MDYKDAGVHFLEKRDWDIMLAVRKYNVPKDAEYSLNFYGEDPGNGKIPHW
jgi:outer membrane protein W